MVLAARLPAYKRWLVLAVGVAAYASTTLALFALAVAGRALFPL